MSTQKSIDAGDLLALENQVCFALAVASRRVIGLYRPLLEPMGLTHPQYLVMLALWQDGPLTVRELATKLSLESATLSPLLKRLETIGYLTRSRGVHDERSLQIALTPKGRALRKQALKIPPTMMDKLGMDVAELKEFHARLTGVIDRATAEERAPTTAR
ncbi:MarR family winged helix-turn-helix transcriptional regulator [Microlunatus soli]|uniref:DNA-binding transcriptional regulator, MarR family n=1 Tax=Microlunatus soli TaxID=630515 RepID=A0A1H1UD54_9ACTN|nr:MarR family transcriptional regulator [Microlunatus soli]SDS70370.1 DNA-binding transcriptional regulator, MarR family [Microlunatus soli]